MGDEPSDAFHFSLANLGTSPTAISSTLVPSTGLPVASWQQRSRTGCFMAPNRAPGTQSHAHTHGQQRQPAAHSSQSRPTSPPVPVAPGGARSDSLNLHGPPAALALVNSPLPAAWLWRRAPLPLLHAFSHTKPVLARLQVDASTCTRAHLGAISLVFSHPKAQISSFPLHRPAHVDGFRHL